jgi:AcrR family transcriptional regulator
MDTIIPEEKVRGSKGERTRQRILDATAQLLTERPFAEIRITEIARVAGIAQPNFYTYFSTIEEAILAIAREVSGDELRLHLEPDWTGEAGVAHARALVEAAIVFWRRHRSILSLVNLLADQRHSEFPAVRVAQMRAIYKSFEAKIRKAQAAGRISGAITPRLAGYECVSIIGSTGAKYELLIASGFTHQQLVETTARLLHLLATGGG